MLFDLSGRRKRFIQVIYAILALLFGITFVGFGIGSDAAGGIFDAIGFGNNNNSSSNPQFERQLEDAEAKLEADPEDRQAMLEIVRLHFLDGQTQVSADPETGIPDVGEEARSQFEAGVAAWQDYLATKPKEPDPGIAALVVRAYVLLEDAGGAAEAQSLVAEETPSSGTYGNLAFYHYADGNVRLGDQAAEEALKLASGSTKKSLARQLKQLAKQAKEFRKAQRDLPKELRENPLENPFGGLGSEGAPGAISP